MADRREDRERSGGARTPKSFKQLLEAEVVSAADGRAELRLACRQELSNHLGGPHAAVIFGLGETAAGSVVSTVFADLLEQDGVPLIKSGAIRYHSVVTGTLIAVAHLRDSVSVPAVGESFRLHGVAVFDVDVTFHSAPDGPTTAEMTAQMAVKRRGHPEH